MLFQIEWLTFGRVYVTNGSSIPTLGSVFLQDPPSVPVQMPMVETGSGGKLDVMSKLLEDRIILCSGPVTDEMAQVLVAQMLYLSGTGDGDITMHINSPGGSVSAGLAIFDTMQFISCDVKTVCFGMAASMGSFLLAAGSKGKRSSLPNSRIMIHQPLGGAQGPASDIHIQALGNHTQSHTLSSYKGPQFLFKHPPEAKEILFMREILNQHLADATGQTMEQIAIDCDRDNFMTPEEAKEYGLIDTVVETKSWPRLPKPPRPEV